MGGLSSMLVKLRALLKAVELGSLTDAAKQLHCTQSALSRLILDLEGVWGIRLLERSRRGVGPTEDLRRLLPMIRRVTLAEEALRNAVGEIRGLVNGTVRIGVFSSIATFWLPKAIRAFERAHPGIDFEMLMGDYAEIERWILEGRVDFGFVAAPAEPRLRTLELHDDELVAILPHDHRLAGKDAVTPEELAVI